MTFAHFLFLPAAGLPIMRLQGYSEAAKSMTLLVCCLYEYRKTDKIETIAISTAAVTRYSIIAWPVFLIRKPALKSLFIKYILALWIDKVKGTYEHILLK